MGPNLATVTPVPDFPENLERKLDAIALKTAAIRGLSLTEPAERRLVSREEMRGILEEDFAEEADEIALDGHLYRLLGIIPPDASLNELLLGVYSDMVLGLYDPDEHTLVVLAVDEAFGAMEELTVTHEIAHSLQQAHYDIAAMSDEAEASGNSDREAALTALIEGDASITETLYMFRAMDDEERAEIEEAYAQADNSAYMAAPVFIRRVITFPYTDGHNFAVDLYLRTNSHAAVDAAYAAPPLSTEQALHPEFYGSDAPEAIPVEVEPPGFGALGGDWRVLDRDVMGELFFQALLIGGMDAESVGIAAEPDRAAAGWGGDAYALLESAELGHAVASVSVWDTPEDAAEFAEALSAYLDGQATLAGVSYRVSADDDVTVRFAISDDDDPATVEALIAAVTP